MDGITLLQYPSCNSCLHYKLGEFGQLLWGMLQEVQDTGMWRPNFKSLKKWLHGLEKNLPDIATEFNLKKYIYVWWSISWWGSKLGETPLLSPHEFKEPCFVDISNQDFKCLSSQGLVSMAQSSAWCSWAPAPGAKPNLLPYRKHESLFAFSHVIFLYRSKKLCIVIPKFNGK